MGFIAWITSPFRRTPPAPALPARGDTAPVGKVAEQLAAGVGGWRLPRRGSAEVLDSYAQHPWLHTVVSVRAEAIGALQWQLFREKTEGGRVELAAARVVDGGLATRTQHIRAVNELTKKGIVEPIARHPVLDLMRQPSLAWPGASFWQLISSWLDLVGEAFIVLERRTAGDLPEAMTPVVPTWVTGVPAPKRPWFDIGHGKAQLKVDARDMIWLRRLDPSDPITGRGVGTAFVLADEVETDEYMAATAKARYFNRGYPDWMVGIKPPQGALRPSDETIKKLKEEIEQSHRGIDRAGRFHLLGSDFHAVDMGHTFREGQFVEGRGFLRGVTTQTYRTPPEIVGVLENSNKGTIHAAGEHFARYSTVPAAELIRGYMQMGLVEEFGEDLELGFVSPIPGDEERDTRLMIALSSAFTVNEVRARANEPRRDDGDVLMTPPGAPPIPIKGEPPKAAAPAVPVDGELPAPVGDAVQDTALNGAQVEALLAVLAQVAAGVLDESAAKAVIGAAFPAITTDKIDAMLAGVGDAPEPKTAPPANVDDEDDDVVDDGGKEKDDDVPDA